MNFSLENIQKALTDKKVWKGIKKHWRVARNKGVISEKSYQEFLGVLKNS